MALKKLESLVLRVVPVVVRDAVAGLANLGSAQATGQALTVPLSFSRHLPPSDPGSDADPMMRYHPANYGEAQAAQRAGRSGSFAGVLGSRTPAITARAAILSGCAGAVREAAAGGRWRHRTTMATTCTTDRPLSGHSRSHQRFPARRDGRAQRGSLSSGRKCEVGHPGVVTLRCGMLRASIGGR